ncbi:MAG: hypothetical protein KJ042_17460, partial [Deltaproteobacteria bacterium]|nr:hypothetical protein [Deltaproteobacteria bacterium]
DDAANALVVRDTAAVLRDIEKLVAKLDVPPTLWNVTISPADGFTELESPKGAEVIDLGPWRVTTMPTGRRESARVTSSAEAAATTLHIRSGESAIFSVGSSVRVDELQGAWFGRHGFGVDLRSASARAEMALRVSGSRENVRLDITPRVVVEIPSGPVMRQLDGIDVPFRKDRSILISIRSGDATDIWGPAGVGVVNAWMLTVTSEYAP